MVRGKQVSRFNEWDDDDDEEDARKQRARLMGQFRGVHPDDLYRPEANSITFIYDPASDRLDAQPFPKYHAYMMVGHNVSPTEAEQMRNVAVEKGQILGRFGEYQYKKVIAYYGNPPEDALKKCIAAIVKQYPEYAQQPQSVILSNPKGEPMLLSEFFPEVQKYAGAGKGQEQQSQTDNDPGCKELGVNVQGRFMPLGELIGNLHMVKGVNLELMKSAFCANYEALKRKAEQMGCEGGLALIAHIASRIECGKAATGTNQEKWDAAKKAGASALRADYQKIFSNPSRIDTEFRGRQRDIDAAWDFLQKGRNETFVGFKQWLMNEGQHANVARRRRRRR